MVLSPAGLPRAHAIAVDGTALLFALAVSMAVAVAVGLLPAFAATRVTFGRQWAGAPLLPPTARDGTRSWWRR